MSRFTDASLMVVPSLYKTSKLYAIKPGTGLADFAVTRSSVKWVLGPNGVLRSVAANTPALEYNADRTFRGMLVEPAATNLFVRSSEFNTTWAKADVTVTDNSLASPDGTTTADTITEGTAGTSNTSQGVTVSSGATATFSTFFKYNNQQWLRIRFSDGANAVNAWVDIQNGVAGTISAAGTGVVGAVRVENYGNGWYRCSVSGSIPATTSYSYGVFSASADASFSRVNNSVYYAWGAQAETGSVATSYIPTVASTQTRTADTITLTSASSLIGQTEGTLYAEAIFANVAGSNFARVLECFTGANDRISILVNASAARGFITTAGVDTQGGTMSEAVANNTVTKIALAYAVGASQGAFYVNGTGDITSPTAVPATASINIGQNIAGAVVPQWIRSVALFPSRLTNAELAALTTL